MGLIMKKHLLLTNGVLGLTVMMTGVGYASSDYLHLVRHRDSQGNLLARPTPHQPETDVLQKTVAPAQPKNFEERVRENQGNVDWGTSIEEVKDNQLVPPAWEVQSPVLEHHEYRVGYHTQIENIDTSLIYTFYDNKLGQATYVFEANHEDASNYVQDFQAVKQWVKQKYGEPTDEQEIWLDDLYAYDKSLWGQAVLRGHLVMMAEWKYPETEVTLVLDGGGDTVGLVADFTSTQVSVPVSLNEPTMEEMPADNQVSIDPLTDDSSDQIEQDFQEGPVDSLTPEERAHAPMPMEDGATGSLVHPENGVTQEDVSAVESGMPNAPMVMEEEPVEVPAHPNDAGMQEDVSAVGPDMTSEPGTEGQPADMPVPTEPEILQKEEVSALDSSSQNDHSGIENMSEPESQPIEGSPGGDNVSNVELESDETPLSL